MTKQEITRKSLTVTALGGLHETGKNMYILESKEPKKDTEYLVIDAGILFPGVDSPGVDYTMSEFNYILNKHEKIQALVLTSVHESHSGGAHHLITKAHIKKVIGSKLAIATVKARLGDEAKNIEWIEFESRKEIKLSSFKIIPFTITSNSAESYAVAVEAQGKKIFYSGTFKIDQSPTDGIKTDIVGITSYASQYYENDEYVDLYIGDSANIEKEGYSKSELELIPKFKDILKRNPSRIIINTYNSCTVRIQNLFNIAKELGRKVALLNKDARETCAAATEAGCLNYDKDLLISIKEIDNYKDEELLIISTAPEHQALEELERIGFDRSLEIQVKKGDLVINSADLPPGTVRVMAQISDQFFLKEVKIMGGANAGVHVESHAMTEELKFMFNLLKPKHFIPALGETRQLIRHAKLAVEAGFDPGSILILDNGDHVDLHGPDAEVTGHTDIGEILFNDSQDFQVDNKIIKEREGLATEGVVLVSFSMNKKRKVVSGPVFSAKACTFSNNKEWRAFCLMNSQDIIDEVEILGDEKPDAGIDDFQDLVRDHMNRIIKTQIGKKSSVIVIANEV